mmetsp:Transcript_42674/g.78920  ORF Transcript_42674/g.78920 Transcript_42674/m.78920 type:complete len:81 (-) Transcript_42674:1134-1376(-)
MLNIEPISTVVGQANGDRNWYQTAQHQGNMHLAAPVEMPKNSIAVQFWLFEKRSETNKKLVVIHVAFCWAIQRQNSSNTT